MWRRLARWWRVLRAVDLPVRIVALWMLMRHPDTPWPCKAVAAAVVAYALSPIDLIPDVIPVLGQLDDLVLLPLGLALAVRLAPPALWQRCLAQAQAQTSRLPRMLWGAALVLLVWAVLLAGFAVWLWSAFVQWLV